MVVCLRSYCARDIVNSFLVAAVNVGFWAVLSLQWVYYPTAFTRGGVVSLTHDSRSGHGRIKKGSERSFGIVFAVVFVVIGLFPLIGNWTSFQEVRIWSLACAAVLLLVLLVAPRLLGPANNAWLAFGLLLNRIISPIVLGLMFFLVLTPIALLRRATSRNSIPMKPDPAVDSYWSLRSESDIPSSMKNQF